MREDSVWTKRVVAAIGRIADPAFQQRAWLGHGPEVASFLETYNTLYDQAFEDFLVQPEWEQTELPHAVRLEMIRLDQLLEAYQVPGRMRTYSPTLHGRRWFTKPNRSFKR